MISYGRTCIARSVALELPYRAQGIPTGFPCPVSRLRRRMYPPPRPQSSKRNPTRWTSRGPPPLSVLRVNPSPLLRNAPRSTRKGLSSSPSSFSFGTLGQTVGCPSEPHLPFCDCPSPACILHETLPTSAVLAIGCVATPKDAEIRSFPDVGIWMLKSKYRYLDLSSWNPSKGCWRLHYGVPTSGIWKLDTVTLIPRVGN